MLRALAGGGTQNEKGGGSCWGKWEKISRGDNSHNCFDKDIQEFCEWAQLWWIWVDLPKVTSDGMGW